MHRMGVPFSVFVPTTSITTPDVNGNYYFSNVPTGVQLRNPFGGVPFQCQPGTNTPEPVNPADGTQTSTQACNIIPPPLINPIDAKLVQLYPPTHSNSNGFN